MAEGDTDMFEGSKQPTETLEEKAERLRQEGNEKFKQKDFRTAVSLYSRAIDVCPENAALYGNRAAAFLMLGVFDRTERDCESALTVDPNFTKAHLRLGKARLSLGKLSQAERAFSKVLELEPKNKSAKEELGNVSRCRELLGRVQERVKQQQWHQALAAIEQSLELASGWRRMNVYRVEVDIGLGKLDKAASDCVRLLRTDNSDVDVIFLRGKVLYLTNNMEAAIKHFQEGLRNDPDHSQSRVMLKRAKQVDRLKTQGNTAFKQRQHAEAVEFYSQALDVDEDNVAFAAVVLCNRAAARMAMRDYEEALADCDSALEKDSEYAKAHVRRGQCNIELGNFEEAVRDYEAAADIDQDSESIQAGLKQAKLELKKSKRKDLYKALEVDKRAGDDEIKKAYKKMALKWHPDKHNSSEETRLAAEKRFKDVGEAYAILSDPSKRQRYDQGVDIEDLDNPMHGGGGHGGFDDDFVNMFFQQQHGGFGGGGFGGGGGGGFRHGGFGGF